MSSLFLRDRPVTTEIDHSPIVAIVTYVLLSFNIVSIATRFLTKCTVAYALGVDDLLILLSLVREYRLHSCNCK